MIEELTAGAMVCFTIVVVTLIWAGTSLEHHKIEARLKNLKYDEPTK